MKIFKSLTMFLFYVLGCVIISVPAYSQTNPSLCATYKNRFNIAVALEGRLPGDYSPKELNLIRTQFNVLTPANCLKMYHIQRHQNILDFEQADAFVAFAVSADEPAGKPVVDCEKQSVCLTIHHGAEDDQLLQEKVAAGFRQARILDLCQEALSQGALLIREDLAYRVFFVSTRTITRDLNVLREQNSDIMIPLRSTIHDIGPVLTHRTKIVRLALEGQTMTQICHIMKHSPRAVNNYLATFARCVQHGDMIVKG